MLPALKKLRVLEYKHNEEDETVAVTVALEQASRLGSLLSLQKETESAVKKCSGEEKSPQRGLVACASCLGPHVDDGGVFLAVLSGCW